MVAIEFLNKLKKEDTLNYALRTGIISLTWIDHKNIYEYYMKELDEEDSKMQALENTCDKFSCKKDKVYNAIKRMES